MLRQFHRWVAPIALVAVAILATLNLYLISLQKSAGLDASSKRSSVYERVIERGEIRVGYLVLPPFLDKNSASGQFSGIFYDFMQEIGQRLELKVSWVEEVNLANMSVGLETGRYDMIAFPLWRSAARAKTMAFSPPLFYATLGVYVRANDARFSTDLSLINSPDVRVSTIDGEVSETIAREDFPLAKLVALPQFSDYSQLLLQVQTGKADVTFFDRVLAQAYLSKNPGHLKEISLAYPIRVFAQTFILPLDDSKFQSMIGTTTTVLVENRVLERLFQKYGQDFSNFYQPALPYRTPAWATRN